MGLSILVKGKGGGGYGRGRWAHGWLSLLAGLVLIIQGVTGAMLGFEKEIRNGLGDGAVAMGERLSPVELVEAVGERLGGGEPAWIIWREATTEPVWVRWRGNEGEEASHLFDPVSGAYLEGSTRWHRIFEGILAVHRTLGAGRIGQVIMGTSALILASLLVSGLYLHWKRARGWAGKTGLRRIRADGDRRGAWRRWHSAIGLWLTPVLLVMALTGPVWSFGSYRAVIGWLTLSEPSYGSTAPVVEAERQTAAIDAILASVEERAPTNGAMRIIFPKDATTPARFEWVPPEAPFENFRSREYLHPSTGAVIGSEPLEAYTRAEKAIRWAYPVHTGFWGGWFTQLLHAATALSLPFFAISGLYLYLKRTRKQQKVY